MEKETMNDESCECGCESSTLYLAFPGLERRRCDDCNSVLETINTGAQKNGLVSIGGR